MHIKQLSSGYWLAWWNSEVWAQWRGSAPMREDFFHPEYAYSEARVEEAYQGVLTMEER